MRVVKATIQGYRSIREPVELHLDPRVTVVLGANDHGKSNLLEALLHLNPDHPFDPETDLNWDCLDAGDQLPRVDFDLQLSADEAAELRELERLHRERAAFEEYLAAANVQLDAATEDETARATEAGTAQTAADQAKAALTSAKEAKDASPDDAAVATALSEAATADRDAQRKLKDAQRAAEAAKSASDGIERRVAAAEARLLSIDASLAGESPDDAPARNLARCEAAMTTADQAEKTASDASSAASAALEAGAATYAEGTPELEQLKKDATTAERAKNAARQDSNSKRVNLRQAQRAVEAANAITTEDPLWQITLPEVPELPVAQIPKTLTLSRVGLAGDLVPANVDLPDDVIARFTARRVPNVQLIRPVDRVPDAVTRAELSGEDAVFMRGIFHFADLAETEWDNVFAQNDVTVRRLADASTRLDETLRESWSQGRRLHFRLQHNSEKQRIELWIIDPAVKKQWVRASRRSSGFTHFFALKTILYAHEKEAPASAYLWVFDEPGVYLHPDGQHDLLQVMETLAQNNQVVYSTHSIFMANKNFPTRHRLVLKTGNGTAIDGKPFRSRWQPAIEALGMSMPGTLLFASRVLLVEGDSDAILINAVLQKLLELGEFDRDVNSLSVMSGGDPADVAALFRLLTEGEAHPRISALFDGDEGGESRKNALEPIAKEREVELEVKLLSPSGTTTEDHLPAAADLYARALATYLSKMSPRRTEDGERIAPDKYLEEINAERDSLDTSDAGLTKGMADWSRTLGKKLGELTHKPSPSGVAREYAFLLQDSTLDELRKGHGLKRARELAKWIAQTLDLPPLTRSQDAIFEDIEDGDAIV